MSDILVRLRTEAADMVDWNGQTMKVWDEIRHAVETQKGGDMPRLMFEGMVDAFADLMVDGADEIERLRQRVAVLEMVIREELYGDECGDDANRMIVDDIHEKMSPLPPSDVGEGKQP